MGAVRGAPEPVSLARQQVAAITTMLLQHHPIGTGCRCGRQAQCPVAELLRERHQHFSAVVALAEQTPSFRAIGWTARPQSPQAPRCARMVGLTVSSAAIYRAQPQLKSRPRKLPIWPRLAFPGGLYRTEAVRIMEELVPARLRVLYLTHHGPLPALSGGRLRDACLIPELAKLADVEVWAVSRTAAADREAMQGYPHALSWRIYRDDGPRQPYPTRASVEARADLSARMAGLRPFDVIHVEGHYLFHLLAEEHRDCAVVVEHNVESHLLAQRLNLQGLAPSSDDAFQRLSAQEEDVWRAALLVITLSEEDRERIALRAPAANLAVSTDGADHLPSLTARTKAYIDEPTIGFLANYAYPPNRDALAWLKDDLYPAIVRQLPGCRLLLAGSNLEDAIAGLNLPDGVLAQGWYPDLTDFWRSIDVMVCPLRIGGGVKVKMIEALRSGALAVTTSIGVEGLHPSVRSAIMCADSADDFVAATVRMCTDEPLRLMKQIRLAKVQDDLPTWAQVAATLHEHWLRVSQPTLGGIGAR